MCNEQALLESGVLSEFISEEYQLISTLMGARNFLPPHLWQTFKTNGGLNPKDNPLNTADVDDQQIVNGVNTIGKFLGVYKILENLSGYSLEYLQSHCFEEVDWEKYEKTEQRIKEYVGEYEVMGDEQERMIMSEIAGIQHRW